MPRKSKRNNQEIEAMSKGAVEGALEASATEEEKRSTKTFLWIIALIALLVAAWAVYTYWYKPRRERRRVEAEARRLLAQ